MIRILYILLLGVFLLSCGEKKIKRKLEGSWNVISMTETDQYGFVKECTAEGEITFSNCQSENCEYTFKLVSSSYCGDYIRDEEGTYTISEELDAIQFTKIPTLNSTDTINNGISILTNKELKLNFQDPITLNWYIIIFEKN